MPPELLDTTIALTADYNSLVPITLGTTLVLVGLLCAACVVLVGALSREGKPRNRMLIGAVVLLLLTPALGFIAHQFFMGAKAALAAKHCSTIEAGIASGELSYLDGKATKAVAWTCGRSVFIVQPSGEAE